MKMQIESLQGMTYDVVALKKIYNPTTGEYFRAKGFETPDRKKNHFKSEILRKASERKTSTKERCQFLIGIAMYNENWEEFRNTLKAVNESLLSLYENTSLTSDNVICLIIVDGMAPFLETYTRNKEEFSKFFCEEEVKLEFDTENLKECTFEYLLHKYKHSKKPGHPEVIEEVNDEDSKEDFQEEVKKVEPINRALVESRSSSKRKEKIEFAHMFSQKIFFGNVRAPLNVVLCVKQFNKRKLNSHLWLFGGFCEVISPDYVMLLDIGTKPLKNSLFYLYDALVKYPDIAGCCGEIRPMAPSFWNLVVQAQVVEYKFSHMLDKALESAIGFITVLPGAFSAYRWEALQGEPLWKDYFKSVFAHSEEMDTFHSNIYLAEDRVLCLSLVSKPGQSYMLRYIRKSVAETDVPDSLINLLAQRRRWINGSWFALIDTILKCKQLLGADHFCCRKLLFVLLIIYYSISAIYSWLMVGIMYVAFNIAVSTSMDSSEGLMIFADILCISYASCIVMILIMSLGAKPKMVEGFFQSTCYYLGIMQIVGLALMIRLLIMSSVTNLFVAGVVLSFGLFALICILNCEIVTVLRGAGHYVFMIPTYVNILLIYSICNTHDCTWGNRPDILTKEEQEKIGSFERFRARWTIIWALCNGLFVFLVLTVVNTASNETRLLYFIGIGGAGIVVLVFRVLGGLIYLLIEYCKTKAALAPGHGSKSSKVGDRLLD
jgi:cellulose synthase/poly-beta-1,6-N-acetylglucosamine synthase-like glycosyltransferase